MFVFLLFSVVVIVVCGVRLAVVGDVCIAVYVIVVVGAIVAVGVVAAVDVVDGRALVVVGVLAVVFWCYRCSGCW